MIFVICELIDLIIRHQTRGQWPLAIADDYYQYLVMSGVGFIVHSKYHNDFITEIKLDNRVQILM